MKIVNDNILRETRGIILHGCNARGAFNSGLAGQIRSMYPIVFTEYRKLKFGSAALGEFQPVQVSDTLFIGNCITQMDFGRTPNTRYASPIAIQSALNKAFFWAALMDKPLFTPEIGCGLGGLSWEEIAPIYEMLEAKYPKVDVTLYRYKP